ncbi:TPR-like protein, partial [Fistulina hepatica ATCC 64428]
LEQKLSTAKQLKDTADQAFRDGNTKQALAQYHQALLYVLGLDRNAMEAMGGGPPQPPPAPGEKPVQPKTEARICFPCADEIVEKIYNNMCACHLKNGKWERAVETANKALAKNENNTKAMFRKAKALAEQGFLERAVKLFQEVKAKNPSEAAAVNAEIAKYRSIDEERDRANKKKLKGKL